MAYLSNNARVHSVTVAGTDYTSNLVSWTASDESANKNGCLITTGALVLATKPGGVLIEDYDRNNFKRGDQVILKMTSSSGSVLRHPRGLLYVVSTSYNAESEELAIELTCRLGLMSLTDSYDELLGIVPIQTDTAQSTFENCCSTFASTGSYVYQTNTGSLSTGKFFDGDGYSGVTAGQWVSVLGVTTNSVSALTGSGAIPDEIVLSYQVPVDEIASDNKGRIDTVETESYYFFSYPAVNYVRINSDATEENPNGTLENITEIVTTEPPVASSGSCGNAPPPPKGDVGGPVGGENGGGNGNSCNQGYSLVQSPVFVPAIRRTSQKSVYDGPGGQLSTVESRVYGPRVEANGQYFSDDFAYCRQTWGDQCNPNGDCPRNGLDEIELGKTTTLYTYGAANELVQTVTDNFSTVLSAAKPSDWRAGNNNGRIQDFDSSLLSNSSLYLESRVITQYAIEDNVNVQTTTQFQSVTSRGVGISGGQSIDALSGIETKSIRRSATNTTLDIAPDIINSSTTSTETKQDTILLFAGRYKTPPVEAGPYVLEEQIPMPLLFDNQSSIDSVVSDYSNYLERFVKGDVFGLQIGEGMRDEVLNGWYPGMPFRYYDPSKVRVIAMRMDATAWGVSTEESAFVTNGVWIGFSNGAVTIPSNTVGNSTPDMTAKSSGVNPGIGGSDVANPLPPAPEVPPSVEDETSVDSGAFAWNVDVRIYMESIAVTYGPDGVMGPAPEEEVLYPYFTTACYVSGSVVGPGQILAANVDGSIPIELLGQLIVGDATVVNLDLFAPETS